MGIAAHKEKSSAPEVIQAAMRAGLGFFIVVTFYLRRIELASVLVGSEEIRRGWICMAYAIEFLARKGRFFEVFG